MPTIIVYDIRQNGWVQQGAVEKGGRHVVYDVRQPGAIASI